MSVASTAALMPCLALALPPAPYQTGPDAAAESAGPQSLDRYGGGRSHSSTPAAPRPLAGQAGPALRGPALRGMIAGPGQRYLSWSGKTAQAAPQAAAPAQAGWASVPRRAAPAPARPPVQAYAAAPMAQPSNAPWRPYRQAAAAPVYAPPAAAPSAPQVQGEQGIPMPGPPVGGWRPYRPEAQPAPIDNTAAPQAAAQPQQVATAQPYKGGARFYSLHRDYGMTPDAIPIPPQFFGPTADLSSPPADPALKRVTTSTGATHSQAVVADDQGAQ